MTRSHLPIPPLLLVLLCSLAAACSAPLRLQYAPGQVQSVNGRGMVVAEEALAAEIGAAVLRDGGNAVDAAVATAFALGVTFPQAGNPGGGGFAVLALPGAEPMALDFREVAPAAATRDMFLLPSGKADRDRSLFTPLAAGVPGTPAGLAALHRRCGRLPWTRLVEPAVALAATGFPVSAELAADLNAAAERFSADPAAATIFVHPDRPWRAGDRLVQSDLAGTLSRVRDRGAPGFYEGPTAAAIAAMPDGIISTADLADYRPEWRAPVRFSYRGREVVTMPLPSSAGVVLPQVLGMLEFAGAAEVGPGSADRLHLFAEAERRAFADRNALLGDPLGIDPVLLAKLTRPAYIEARAATIDPRRATPSAGVEPGAEPESTTNLVVIDRDGGAISLTYTLNGTFGTHIVVPGTGVILNNEMDDFAARPGAPNQFGLRQGEKNAVVPGRRPLSSMSPTLVRQGDRVILAVGSPGGPRILTAVALTIVGHVGDGLPLDLAVLAPRIHCQHLPDALFYENAEVVWPEGVVRADLLLDGTEKRDLTQRGHHLVPRDSPIGRVTAASVDPATGEITGVADARTGGAVVAE